MSTEYQQLCALCRLASYGIDTISAATPEVKALKAAAKNELANMAYMIATAPAGNLHNLYGVDYYNSRQLFSRNEFGDFDEFEAERAYAILELVWDVKYGLGCQLEPLPDDSPFRKLWLYFENADASD